MCPRVSFKFILTLFLSQPLSFFNTWFGYIEFYSPPWGVAYLFAKWLDLIEFSIPVQVIELSVSFTSLCFTVAGTSWVLTSPAFPSSWAQSQTWFHSSPAVRCSHWGWLLANEIWVACPIKPSQAPSSRIFFCWVDTEQQGSLGSNTLKWAELWGARGIGWKRAICYSGAFILDLTWMKNKLQSWC